MKRALVAAILASCVASCVAQYRPACDRLQRDLDARAGKAAFEPYDIGRGLGRGDERVTTPDRSIEIMQPACELQKKPDARIGMTGEQVINNTRMGKPDVINRTVGKRGPREQWVYEGGPNLYFEDGKLTSFETR